MPFQTVVVKAIMIEYCICGHPKTQHIVKAPLGHFSCWSYKDTGKLIECQMVVDVLRCRCDYFELDNLSYIEILAMAKGLI